MKRAAATKAAKAPSRASAPKPSAPRSAPSAKAAASRATDKLKREAPSKPGAAKAAISKDTKKRAAPAKERPIAAKPTAEKKVDDDDDDDAEEEGEPKYRVKLRMGTVALPDGLVRAVSHVTRGQNRDALAAAGAALSEALRARTRSGLQSEMLGAMTSTQDIPTLAYNEVEATAYAAHRLPGVYACVTRVLGEVRAKVPQWTPRRMLDFGSGPGTAVWAAHSAWPEDLRTFTLVDRSPHMARLAKTLTTDIAKLGAQLSWRRNLQHVPPHDLVSCSYVLSELQSDRERANHLAQLWERLERGGVLIIIEPGTPLGFEYIRRARAQLLGLPEASVVAPCPHAQACPMAANSWCHFAQRVQRTPWQMKAKRDASVNWEDEKFSYVALRKAPTKAPADFARIVRAPMKRGGHVMLTACMPTGHMETRTVTKGQGRARFRQSVKTKWGDGFRFSLPGE